LNKDWNYDLGDHTCDINASPAFECYTAMNCWTYNTSYKAHISYTNGIQTINLSTTRVPFVNDSGNYASYIYESIFYALQPFITGNVSSDVGFAENSYTSFADIDLMETTLPASAELKDYFEPDAMQQAVANGGKLRI